MPMHALIMNRLEKVEDIRHVGEEYCLIPSRLRIVRWLQRLAWWFLRRQLMRMYKTVRAKLGEGGISELINFSAQDIEKITTHRAKWLIIGYRHMYQLIDDRRMNWMDSFSYDDTVKIIDGQRKITMYGLRVIVVPWIEGWALLPDLDEQHRAPANGT